MTGQRHKRLFLFKETMALFSSRALMFIALDKLHHQELKQAIIVVPEKTSGAGLHDEPLSRYGFSPNI